MGSLGARVRAWLSGVAVDVRAERRVALLVTLGLALGQWGSALATGLHTGFGDWQMVHHGWEAAWVSVTRFGEVPLWDPFHCGGVPQLGNPESQAFGPQFLLAFPLGTTLALKVLLILHAWFGFYWAYRWARAHHGLGIMPSYVASITWAASGYFAWQIGGGHATFLPFYFAPGLLMAARASATDARGAVALAGLMGLTVMEGGTYAFPYFVVLVGFDALTRLFTRRTGAGAADALTRLGSRGAVLRGVLTAAALTGLLGAIRFLPIMDVLRRYPRTVPSTDRMQPFELLDLWGRWSFPWEHPLHDFVWPEYVAFISPPLLVLAIAGVGVAINRRSHGAWVGALFFIALLLGDHGPFSPWALLHRLPIYDSLRLPSRFSGLATLYVAALTGFGFQALQDVCARLLARRARLDVARVMRFVAPALAVGCTAWLVVWSAAVSNKFHDPPLVEQPPAESFHFAPPHTYGLLVASFPRMNVGTSMCYVGNMNWRIGSGMWTGERPQARVEGRRNRAGEVVEVARTPNRFHATAQLIRDGRVVFNQNYDPDWQSNFGEVVEDRGRLAVDLPEGEHKIIVRYAPHTFVPGLTGTGMGLLLSWLVFVYGYRPRGEETAAA
ncbi:MAG: hypothetical protein R3B40_18260 [Polyangiales bacterium]